MFLGMVLIPPVLLKLASTGYRFVRYYAGSRPYRVKGPPLLPLRLLAPLLVVTTVLVLGSGVWLMVLGHLSDAVLELHKVSFIVWARPSPCISSHTSRRCCAGCAAAACPARACAQRWSRPRSAPASRSRSPPSR